jgi:4-amino-4-deoxy-L-arabinose transferase-like glycosyltransferase
LVESATLAALALALALLVAFLTSLAPTRFATGVDRYPPTLIFRNFYGVEMNAGGAYRWAKPSAALTFPVAAPATYRLGLTLSDAPAAAPRPVTVYVNGVQVGTVTPEATPRDYPFTIALSRAAWARGAERSLTVELIAPAYVPPGDQRPLGTLLSGIAVSADQTRAGGFPSLYVSALLVLTTLYAAARLLGLSWRGGGGGCGLLLAGLTVFAALDRSAALWVVCQPLINPLVFGVVLLVVLVLAALARVALYAPLDDETATSRARFPEDDRLAFWSRHSLPFLPILALAAGVRLYHFERLNLWFDEGATILFARLPWVTVLGLRGQYEPHPPLYYAAVKLVELVLPVVSAGRLLGIVAGTLTVAVVYALATRLLGRVPGLVVALVLSLSPLHIWYSREARMYAPSALLVACAALALVGFAHAGTRRARWGWSALYGLSCLLAMYVVYSSFYPLAAQGVIVLVLARRYRRQALPLWVALAVAAVAYLPWLPQIFSGVNGLADRSGALGPTPGRLHDLLLATFGLGGVGQRGESYYPGIWETHASWRGLFLLLLAPTVVLGLVALARRSTLAALTAGTLLLGTITVAVVTSAYSPGFAPRTLLPVVLGWAVLVGAAVSIRHPRGVMITARVGIVGVLLLSVGSLRAMGAGAEKQHYREAAVAGAVAATFGQPLVAIGYMTAFFDAYAPQLNYAERSYLDHLVAGAATPAALWLAYGEDPWEDMPAVRARLGTLGFERLTHQQFGDTIYLDLFARRDVELGSPVTIADGFAVDGGASARWQLPSAGARVEGSGQVAQLRLTNEAGIVSRASLTTPIRPGDLYISQAAMEAELTSGRGLLSLSCLDARGATTAIASAETPNAAGGWQTLRAALWCPVDSTQVRIDLDNRGVGTVSFHDARLSVIARAAP